MDKHLYVAEGIEAYAPSLGRHPTRRNTPEFPLPKRSWQAASSLVLNTPPFLVAMGLAASHFDTLDLTGINGTTADAIGTTVSFTQVDVAFRTFQMLWRDGFLAAESPRATPIIGTFRRSCHSFICGVHEAKWGGGAVPR